MRSRPNRSKPDPFDTPEKAYAKAERIIAEAQRSRATEIAVELRYLREVPSSIAGLTALHSLRLDDTEVADLTPFAGLTALRSLSLTGSPVVDLTPLAGLTALQDLHLDGTQVADLAPLAGLTTLQTLILDGTQVADLAPLAGLTALQFLWLDGTQVADLAPLAGLTTLQFLWLDGTQVADLAPLSGLTALQFLRLDDTQVADLAPLAGLTALQYLWLDRTQVADLAPLAGLVGLIDATNDKAPDRFGLSYNDTPAAGRRPFDEFVKLSRGECTAKTINHLRRQQGLPEHVPAKQPLGNEHPPKVAPAVPRPRSAAIEPIWQADRLALPRATIAADLDKPDLDAALESLKRKLTRLADDARIARKDGTGNAIAEHAVTYLERLAADIPTTAPKQHELFEVAHELEVLRAYGKSVNGEWPELLAARYHSLTLAFDDTVRQFPKWREFKRNAAKDKLTAEEIAEAPLLAKEIAKELRAEDAKLFVDPDLPSAVEQIAAPLAPDAPARSPIAAGQEELAEDVLESVNNVLKLIYRAALSAWEAVKPERDSTRKHVHDARTEFNKLWGAGGKKTAGAFFKWARRVAKSTAVGTLAWLGYKLAAALPAKFGWLDAVLKFFQSLG